MTLLELPSTYALILYWAVPIITLSIISVLIALVYYSQENRIVRWLSYLVKPPQVEALEPSTDSAQDISQQKAHVKNQLMLRLFVIYLAILVFFLANFIAEYFHVMADVTQILTQGSTGLTREWYSIVFLNPFQSGWIGYLPFYGPMPGPPFGIHLYHGTWEWPFWVEALTDNPDFFSLLVVNRLQNTTLIGIIFLIPLAIPFIWRSFVPSMFLLTTAILILARPIFGCFGQAVKLLFFGDVLQYGFLATTIANYPHFNWPQFFTYSAVLLVLLFSIFFAISWLLSRSHYPVNRQARIWYSIYVMITFWGTLGFMILL
jgi:hypothetical protein